MHQTTCRNVITFGTAALLATSPVAAQQVTCTTAARVAPDPLDVAAVLRSRVPDPEVLRDALFALVRYEEPHPEEELAVLADSIMVVGLDLAHLGTRGGYTLGTIASNILITAATWRTEDQSGRGLPYPPAADRVVEMAERRPHDAVRALREVRSVIGDERWRAQLRLLALSDATPGAARAIVELAEDVPRGMDVLRELYEADLVTEPGARWYLQRLATGLGWGQGRAGEA